MKERMVPTKAKVRPAGGRIPVLEKAAIGVACQALIDTFLKPRFLPEVRVTTYNYPIDIRGAFNGVNYRFMQRYRSGFADNLGWEFNAPFCRLEYVDRDRFDISWHRHTGQWCTLYRGKSLDDALNTIIDDGILHPP